MLRLARRSLLCVLALALPLSADDSSDADHAVEGTPARRELRTSTDTLAKYREGLARQVTVRLEEVPLKDVLAATEKIAAFRFHVDELALSEEGIPLDEPITLRARKATVEACLGRVLEPLNLTWTVRHGAFTITSSVAADDNLLVHVYDVRPLLARPPRLERLESVLHSRRTFPVRGFSRLLGGLGQFRIVDVLQPEPHPPLFPFANDDLPPPRAHPLADDEWLPRLLRWYCGPPEAWVDQGGLGSIVDVGGRYVIRQTQQVHDEVDVLLGTLALFIENDPPRELVRPFETPAERRIRRVLDERISIRFEDEPLFKVAERLAARLGIDIGIEEIAFEEEGIPLDEKITLTAEDATFRDVLSRILEPLNVEWYVRHDQLVLTVDVVAEEIGNLRLAMVDVRDLVPSFGGTHDLVEAIRMVTGPPESWDDQGGPGSVESMMGGVLVVRQEEETIVEIERFLAMLRRTSIDRPAIRNVPQAGDVRLLDYTLTEHEPATVGKLVEAVIEPGVEKHGDWVRIVGRQLFVRTKLAKHVEIDELLRTVEPQPERPSEPDDS